MAKSKKIYAFMANSPSKGLPKMKTYGAPKKKKM